MVKTVEERKTITEESTNSEKETGAFLALNQFVNLIFGVIIFILLIRFIFKLTGANPSAQIVSLTYSVSNYFMSPFRFIFPAEAVNGAVIEWSVIVAMFFYALFAWIIMKLISILVFSVTKENN